MVYSNLYLKVINTYILFCLGLNTYGSGHEGPQARPRGAASGMCKTYQLLDKCLGITATHFDSYFTFNINMRYCLYLSVLRGKGLLYLKSTEFTIVIRVNQIDQLWCYPSENTLAGKYGLRQTI